MSAFEFKLEAVLNHRRRAEQTQQQELARLLRERLILETQLRDMQSTITEDKSSMADALQGRVDVGRIRRHAAHSLRMTGRAQQIALKMYSIHKQIEQSQSRVRAATAARKAVELLRERQWRRWREEQDRRETAELDDLTLQRWVRRQREGDA